MIKVAVICGVVGKWDITNVSDRLRTAVFIPA
jgi:hypothetical protein